MGGPFTGTEAGPWGTLKYPNNYASDLITLRPRTKEDWFSTFIAENAIRYLKGPLKKFQSEEDRLNGMMLYEDKTVLRFTYVIIGTLAGLAPILSIMVLSKLHTIKARLWVAATFNIGIALSLQLFTEAKRMDIFAVTAASVPHMSNLRLVLTITGLLRCRWFLLLKRSTMSRKR